MTNQEQTAADLAGLKPFRLVKFFSFTGLAVFLVFTLVLSWVISNHAKQVLLERSEGYALVFAENLNHQVFQQFVLPTVLRYGKIALRNPTQFNRLDAIVRNTTHGLKIESVTIFDSQENVISYSTSEERVGRRGEGGVEYEKALEGLNNSRLVFKGSLLNLLPGTGEISCQLVTYIPFRQERPLSQSTDLIMGVIELVQDLSEDFEAILRLQGMIIFTSVLIMSALFAVLRFIVARADRIIEARAIERRRLEEKLHQSERLASLGKMVAAVSHEIKNPLGIVRSTAEILRKRIKAIAPENEHLAEIIISETIRLDGIVREFLDFARPQTPRLALVSLNDTVAKVLRFMEPELEKLGVGLEAQLDESIDPLRLDEGLLYRALLNILVNALQAMPEGGTLRVATRRPTSPGAGAVIEIADTGCGISAEKQKQIFNPFFTDKYRGTGLGLAIAKNIVDSHRGVIAVESEEGQGALFRVTLMRL
jgi:two-component system, NtrC family, sensor histidine kinase HydH